MNLIRSLNNVPIGARDIAPVTGTPGWATDGNPLSGTPATEDDAYVQNMIIAELTNVIAAAGITLDDTNWGQLLLALNVMYGGGSGGFSVANPGYLILPAGFILNFSSQAILAGATYNFVYAKPFAALPLLALSNPGGNSSSGAYPANMNVRNTATSPVPSTTVGYAVNPNAATVAYDLFVLGR